MKGGYNYLSLYQREGGHPIKSNISKQFHSTNNFENVKKSLLV